MVFADDVVLCCEEDLDRWHDELEKKGMKVSRAKTEYMCMNGVSRGSVQMQDHQLLEVKEFKYLGRMLQADEGVEADINQRTQSGWNNWKKTAGVMFDKRIITGVK